jgi:uncharacterized protein YpiB (UPF0302 family)
MSTVTAQEKRNFLRWFLEHYELKSRPAAWLLKYLSSKDKLLSRVHFVDDVKDLPRSLCISTKCVTMPPFQFVKNKRVGYDVECAFYDIQMFPEEEIWVGLYFKDRANCPKFAAVLEVNPMERQDLVQDHLVSLFAEMILDQAVFEFEKERLLQKIDDALAAGDKERFYLLCEEYQELLKNKYR